MVGAIHSAPCKTFTLDFKEVPWKGTERDAEQQNWTRVKRMTTAQCFELNVHNDNVNVLIISWYCVTMVTSCHLNVLTFSNTQ